VAVAAGLSLAVGGASNAFLVTPGQSSLRGHASCDSVSSCERMQASARANNGSGMLSAVSAGLVTASATVAFRRRNTRIACSAEKASAAKEDTPAKEETPAKEAAEPAKEKAEEAAAPAEPAAEEAKEAPKAAPRTFSGYDPTKEPGVTEPLGFWDPLEYCPDSKAEFQEYRRAELKHGRVAMMAAAGAVVQHFITFPGFGDVSRGMGAMFEFPANLGFLLLLAGIAALELNILVEEEGKEPGDFNDPAGLLNTPWGEYDMAMRNKELNNGRFAMIASMGIIVAENDTGLDAVEQLFGL